ncbi:unnamed protein product [Phytophthora fragariaefolia]|uniref:Unnamed protein product n=1 Tax=Phytophthora fragariaefolia TaxID=1490495 RepID=A0A9W6X9J6_9STRA|nr:unnamed protein product [Phytophthora fragariaefolia]
MSATGRGAPVLDFFVLDETMETKEVILEFFKSHNSSWTVSETVLIEKTFKEWRVLNKCFRQVAVLLCQLMTNWKKVVNRVKYGVNGIQRDEVENSIKQMMYSTTTGAFNRERDGFKRNARVSAPISAKKTTLRFPRTFKRTESRVARSGPTIVVETISQQETNRIDTIWI